MPDISTTRNQIGGIGIEMSGMNPHLVLQIRSSEGGPKDPPPYQAESEVLQLGGRQPQPLLR